MQVLKNTVGQAKLMEKILVWWKNWFFLEGGWNLLKIETSLAVFFSDPKSGITDSSLYLSSISSSKLPFMFIEMQIRHLQNHKTLHKYTFCIFRSFFSLSDAPLGGVGQDW